MKERSDGYLRRLVGVALAGSLLASVLPGARVLATAPEELPACASFIPADEDDGVVIQPWRATLDAEGAVIGHRLVLLRGGVETVVRLGRRGFAARLDDERTLLGERTAAGTRVAMLDTRSGCLRWTRQIDGLAYPLPSGDTGAGITMTLHEPGTRRFRQTLRLDVETGATGAVIDGECANNCAPGDGDIPAVAYEPAGAPRPVPNFAGGAWPKGKTLPFRWRAGATPPEWARGPLKAGADDARRTALARSPRFVHRGGVNNSVAYGGSAPCNGIACAARYLPTGSWNVWLRPHGKDYAWGTLRWCQKPSSGNASCFDIRRVMLHEVGHISGLNHPESSGFRLDPHESVMHAITPSRGAPGGGRHAYGRCDVATLQELYDVPDNRTPISTCNNVETRLTLSTSKSTVTQGSSVKLKAVLRVANKPAYRQLAGNPLNGRTLKLKYRRVGSGGAWSTLWMKSLFSSGRYELTISPTASWEFKAAFAAPTDEGLRYSRSDIVKVKVMG